MSSEEEADQRFREMRRTTPEWWRDVYIDEYIGDEEPGRTEAREDFDAMIQHIERRVLAQQPTRVHLAHDERCICCNDVAAWMAKVSRERTARAAQTQETSALPPTDTPDAKKSQA